MPQKDEVLLASWKEIAAHLGTSTRTVQRWERELGLPVRRPERRRSGIVLADADELDNWFHQQEEHVLLFSSLHQGLAHLGELIGRLEQQGSRTPKESR